MTDAPAPARRPRFFAGAAALLLLGALAFGKRPARAQAPVSARLTPAPTAALHTPPGLRPSVTPDELTMPAALKALRPPPPWSVGATGRLSASQAAYRNWTEGGLNTLALTTALQGEATRKTETWQQTHKAQFTLGFIQQDTLAIRKADDRLLLSSTLQYRDAGFFQTFNPTLAVSLRTQFLGGHNYDENPFEDQRETPVEVSDLFSPATVAQSIGLTYEPKPWATQRLSLGAKQVLVTEPRLRTLYGLSPNDGLRYDAGLESTTEVDRRFFEDVRVQSSLQLFAAFNREGLPDMRWENLVSLEFNDWLSLDFELAALYNRDVTQALQVREAVSLGASVTML
jgi:hypothetical protein